MNSDLVSSTCDRLTINKRETAPAILEALNNRKICPWPDTRQDEWPVSDRFCSRLFHLGEGAVDQPQTGQHPAIHGRLPYRAFPLDAD